MKPIASTAALLALFAVAGVSQAQTDMSLMLAPWPDASPIDADIGSISLIATDTTDGSSTGIDLGVLDLAGRFRPGADVAPDPQLTFGFELNHLDLDTLDPALPERLHNSSLAIGGHFGDFTAFDRPWQWGGTFGVGHASSNPFGDGNGWYALGSAFAITPIDEQSQLTLGMSYDGNSAVFPDLPLPILMYQTQYSDTVALVLGFPMNALIWTPDDKWEIIFSVGGVDVDIHAQYELNETTTLFGSYGGDIEGFHIADDNRNRRLFYSRQNLETGVAFGVAEGASFVVAVGMAFDQEFERGFDLRDTDTVRKLDDASYFRIGGSLSF